MLFIFIAQIVLGMVDRAIFGPTELMHMTSTGMRGMEEGMSFAYSYQPQQITGIFMLATLVPSLAVGARRLHDTGRSGWWQLLVLIPLIGIIVLIVFWATQGSDSENNYGPAPQA